MPRRNAVILMTAAEFMRDEGWWGELWFGNLAGETPAVRGDKSARFVATTQQLMGALGHDVQVVQPLRGLDKTDLVRWARDHGKLDKLRRTKSCFDEHDWACGRCQSCFRKMVAFEAAGEATAGMFTDPQWLPHVRKYRPLMQAALQTGDFSQYSPARCRDTLAVIERFLRNREAGMKD